MNFSFKHIDTIVFELTLKCNLSCNFCYIKRLSNKTMSEVTIKNAFKLYKNLKRIVFTGGEPLIVDYLQYLVGLLDNKPFYKVLYTNGMELLMKQDFSYLSAFDEIVITLNRYIENKVFRKFQEIIHPLNVKLTFNYIINPLDLHPIELLQEVERHCDFLNFLHFNYIEKSIQESGFKELERNNILINNSNSNTNIIPTTNNSQHVISLYNVFNKSSIFIPKLNINEINNWYNPNNKIYLLRKKCQVWKKIVRVDPFGNLYFCQNNMFAIGKVDPKVTIDMIAMNNWNIFFKNSIVESCSRCCKF